MIVEQLAPRGITDPRVLAAMSRIPRERFVPSASKDHAYLDSPLPIGNDQTISQPYIVALMSQLLKLRGHERVLEIGAGCGYQSAILAHLATNVCALEINEELQKQAEVTLCGLGITNVDLRRGSGLDPWPERGHFDAILAACAPTEIPSTLIAQLAPGGRLVLPVGPSGGIQTLQRLWKLPNGTTTCEDITPVRFVPMLAPGS